MQEQCSERFAPSYPCAVGNPTWPLHFLVHFSYTASAALRPPTPRDGRRRRLELGARAGDGIGWVVVRTRPWQQDRVARQPCFGAVSRSSRTLCTARERHRVPEGGSCLLLWSSGTLRHLNQVALVTGACPAGRAIALSLANAGADLAVGLHYLASGGSLQIEAPGVSEASAPSPCRWTCATCHRSQCSCGWSRPGRSVGSTSSYKQRWSRAERPGPLPPEGDLRPH